MKRLMPAVEAARNGGKQTPIKPFLPALEALWEVRKMMHTVGTSKTILIHIS